MQVEESALAKVDLAKKYLAEARDITDILKVHDMAVAAHAYATARGANEAALMATEVKLRSERKAGQFLKDEPGLGTQGGDRRSKDIMSLETLQIKPQESKRWQAIAKIPERKFEEYLGRAKEKTQAALLQVAKEIDEELNPPIIEPVHIPSEVRIGLENIDFRKSKLASGSIDFVLTDPPYADLDAWGNLGVLGAKVLKEGGVLAAYAGQSYLRQELEALSKSLNYVWTMAIFFGGNTDRMHQIGAYVGWKPILLFCKGKWKIREFNDTLNGPRSDKRFHEWGQPFEEFMVLLEYFSKPGDTVLDPMVGGGSVVEACIKWKRHCIAYEKDPEVFAQLEKRFPNGHDN